MQGRLIPARFLTLIGHLCVVITLLWESEQSTRHCLPMEFHREHLKSYQKELVGGYGASIALIGLELISFLSGITMFSTTAALVSTGCHGMASIVLAYFILDSWQCGWFWFIFAFCSVFPFLIDVSTNNLENKDERRGSSSNSWTSILIIAGLATTIGSSIPVGYNIGVVNTPAEIIKQFCNESFQSRYDSVLTESSLNILWSSIVSIFIIGGVTGSFVGAIIADNVGRKGGIYIANGFALAGAIFFVVSYPQNSVEMLLIGRLLVGLAGGLTTSIVPMYLTEISPLRLRGSMGVLCPLGITFGVLFGQILSLNSVLGKPDQWHYLLGVFGIPIVIFTPLMLILPESPKYLMAIKNDYDSAVKSLCQINKKTARELSDDILELRAEGGENNTNDEKWGLLQVIRTPEMRIPLLLVCFMQAGQQTSGINAVFYYSNSIFLKANLSESEAELATIGTGIINCAMAIAAIPFMAHFGRRPLAIISIAFSAICLVTLCLTIKLIDSVEWMPKLCIAAVCLYVLFYGLGLGPIAYFIGSELFEVGPRPAAMALGSLSNWAGNFLVGMTFPSLQAAIGPYSFLLFFLSTACLCVFIKLFLPETKGKSPTEIAEIFRSKSNVQSP